MSFLITSELKTVATQEIINIITNSDDTIVEDIIDESIDLIKSYLHEYYDVIAIFSKEGAERSKVVLKYLKDIVVYEVYTRRTKQMNEVAQKRYDDAILWLEQIAKGKIKPDLPLKQVDTNGDGLADSDAKFMKLSKGRSYQNHW